jgi:hypothetical protein
MRERRKTLISLVLVGACLAGEVLAGARADDLRKETDGAQALLYLPTPHQARLVSLGFEQLVADWYWVKGLQYFTDPARAQNHYRNLGDILDVVVGVDPDFEYAYKFAGVSLPCDTGRLRWANTARAIGFLQRGVARFPGNWQLHFYLGFYLLNFRNDRIGAGEELAAAAKIPGSPSYLKGFATRLFSAGGDLDRALVFARTMLESATDPDERAQLERRIQDVELEGVLRRLETDSHRFKEEKGRWPSTPQELNQAYGTPPGPSGVTLVDGVAHEPPGRERMIIYEHPTEGKLGTSSND